MSILVVEKVFFYKSILGYPLPTMPKSTVDSAPNYILSLDVGTLSVRAALYDASGNLETMVSKPIHLNRLSETEVEQNPIEMRDALFVVMNEVLAVASAENKTIIAAGLTTQRSSIVAWNRKTGEPLSPILSWQDRRAAAYLKLLASKGAKIKKKSGLFLTPYYGASKLRWLLDNCPPLLEEPDLIFGPLAAFIVHSIVESHPCIVDHVNASRTQLMDLEARDWSPALLQNFKLPSKLLPRCQPTQSYYGTLTGTEIPLTAVNGDQNAAIHGSGKVDEGTLIVNIGTGAFVLLSTGNRPIHHPRLLASIANSNENSATYLLEGTVNSAGAALNWASEQWNVSNLSEQLAGWLSEVENPPIFINTIGGLGSPHWTTGPATRFIGDGTLAEKAVAIAESIIFLIQINFEAMRNTGQVIKRIRISGGLAALDNLCQLLADISKRAVVRSAETQSTARGIAWLASNQSESWENQTEDFFLPKSNRPLQARYRKFCAELGWS